MLEVANALEAEHTLPEVGRESDSVQKLIMLITELRITMPMTIGEYQVGMLFGVAKASLDETGGGEGVEVLNNEPYDDVPLLNGQFKKGQYTKKIYHLETKVPGVVKAIAPSGSLQLLEEAWNAHPHYCKTVITNPGYMKSNFALKIETFCAENDRGDLENAHQLSKEQLAVRKVIKIDIGNDALPSADAKAGLDASKFRSEKANRGPLGGEWRQHVDPVMTVYKLITGEFKWFGLQTVVENFIMSKEHELFTKLHRQIYCSMDEWFGMNLDDIRAMEDKTKDDLDEQRKSGQLRGTMAT